jgi:Tfp pilus assembly protein PilO
MFAEGRIMKRLFFVLLMLVVGIVGLGFYRGWFTANQDKIQQDEQRAKEEVRELIQEVKAKTGEPTDKVKVQE